jgi:hypothetical protein
MDRIKSSSFRPENGVSYDEDIGSKSKLAVVKGKPFEGNNG